MANANRKVSSVSITTPTSAKVTGMDYSNASHLVTAIARMKEGGISFEEGFVLGCHHIMALTTKTAQVAASKALGLQLIAFESKVNNDVLKIESAIRRVQRKVKSIDAKFVWAKSQTEVAKKKAASRAKKHPAKAESKGKIIAVKKSTPQQVIDNVVIQMRKIQSETENLIPAGNIEAYRSAFVAFISTIKTLTK